MLPEPFIVAKAAKFAAGIVTVGLGKVFFAEALPVPGGGADTTVITSLIREAPWAVALILVCWLFLRYMLSVMADNRKMVESITREHLDARSQTREALLQVAEATKANVAATQKNNDLLEVLARAVEKQSEKLDRHR